MLITPQSTRSLAHWLLSAGLILGVISPSHGADTPPSKTSMAQVSQPWIRAIPPVSMMTAGYMQLHNPTATAITLIGANSGRFQDIEIHRTETQNGVARMVQQSAIAVAANSTISFEPGSYHLMLMQPTTALTVNETIPISLHFADGSTLQADFTVQPATGDDSHAHHHHHPAAPASAE